MVACPGEVVWPDVGDPMLLVDSGASPTGRASLEIASDEAPALGGFLDSGGRGRRTGRRLRCRRPAYSGGSVRHRLGQACPATVASRGGLSGTGTRRSSGLDRGGLGLNPLMRPLVIPVTTLAMSMSPCWRSANCSRSLEGMGSENMVPSGKIGLGQPPDPESKPLRLMISFLGFKLVRPELRMREGSTKVIWYLPFSVSRLGLPRLSLWLSGRMYASRCCWNLRHPVPYCCCRRGVDAALRGRSSGA